MIGAAALLAATTQATASRTTASWPAEDVVVARGEVLWDPGGEPLSVESRDQERPRLVRDGASGAIVVWQDDHPENPGIYAQRVLWDGTAAWATNGVSISGHGAVYWPDLVEDGAGGAIVTWVDERNGDRDVYAQRVLSDGTAAWATGGISVCAAPGWQVVVGGSAPDGAGGAIVVWDDYRGGDIDVYAQRVLSDGTMAWAAGAVALTALAGDQWWATVTSDGAGGGIVVWHGGCDGVASICAQRVGPDGTPVWQAGGIPVGGGGGSWPVVTGDGAGGAFVAWEVAAGQYNSDLYAQRVLSDGTVAWAAGGVALTQAGGYQWFQAIASDGEGGAIVAWQDERVGPSDPLVYAQRVLSDGTMAWEIDGSLISTETTYGYSPDILGDGEGGAWVVWCSRNVHAQRLRPDGTARWTETLLVCNSNAGRGQDYPRLVSDGAGGAVVAWQDNRRWYKVDNYDIYAQRIGEVSHRYYFPAVFED